MKKISAIVCLLVALTVHAEYTGPGFYRVHNVRTDCYISIKGTEYNKSSRPDAFWSCVKMADNLSVVSDPGSIIYIPDTVQVGLYSQGVDTYSLTGLPLDVMVSPSLDNDMVSYLARTEYNGFTCYFRDYGNGMTAGSNTTSTETHWWIEPVSEESIETSYFGVQPADPALVDAEGYYWTTLCCDFPVLLPVGGGVEGAYTITEVKTGDDSLQYAQPVKVYGQGETVPAATAVLLKCASADASGNKLIPVGEIANNTTMPVVSDMLMGNYFSTFENHAHLTKMEVTTVYTPYQATMAAPQYLALAIDENGKLAFMPKQEGTYMDANTAWLCYDGAQDKAQNIVYLGEAPVSKPLVGDTNGDGKIDVSDVTSLIVFVLGDTIAPDEEVDPKTIQKRMSFDVNEDGVVDVVDVTNLIAIVLQS